MTNTYQKPEIQLSAKIPVPVDKKLEWYFEIPVPVDKKPDRETENPVPVDNSTTRPVFSNFFKFFAM